MKVEQKKWTKENGWVSVSSNRLKERAQLVFLFGEYSLLKGDLHLKEVKELYPKSHIIGCSTAGEIVGNEVLDNSLVATAVFFEDTKLQFAKTRLADMSESNRAGQELANDLKGKGLHHVFVLSEGLNVNGSGLARGLNSQLPDPVSVTGGLAGDQGNFKETVAFLDNKSEKNTVSAVGFYGNSAKIGYGSRGGWDSFGLDRKVTRSEGNVLYELDGQPALELYKKYLGDHAEGLPATALLFPLNLRSGSNGEVGLVRTVLSVDEEKGSMTFAGDVPEGSYARLMRANLERLVDGAADAANQTLQTSSGPFASDLAILISCVGRKLVLRQRVEEEVEAVHQVLGDQSVMAGFYSYGELCPIVPTDKQCELHNQTMTVTTFAEK